MPDYTSVERAVMILGKIARQNRITVKELYRYFDGKISTRTLQRDLERLSSAHVPLVTEPGKGRELVWSIEPSYLKFIPIQVGLDEFFSVEILRNASAFFKGTPIEKDIEAAVQKMKQLVPKDVIASTNTLGAGGEYLEVHKYGYVDYRDKGEFLRTFLWAAIRKQVCEVEYKKSGDQTVKSFTVYPYTLIHHRGAFYGVVFQPKHQNYIYLLIHRLQKIEPTSELFHRDKTFSLDTYLKDAFGIWREDPQEVRIAFSPEVAATIRERIWHPSQKTEDKADGSTILTMTVAANAELIAWILYWGSFAKVLAPESLAKEVASMLQKSLDNYQ